MPIVDIVTHDTPLMLVMKAAEDGDLDAAHRVVRAMRKYREARGILKHEIATALEDPTDDLRVESVRMAFANFEERDEAIEGMVGL